MDARPSQNSLRPVGAAAIQFALCTALCGCVTALHPYNQPSQKKLRLMSPAPQHLAVRVATGDAYPVGSDGRVTVNVPRLERGCAVYLFGFIKVKDCRAEDVQAIHIRRDARTVRRMSLNDIDQLPVDAAGYHLVRVP